LGLQTDTSGGWMPTPQMACDIPGLEKLMVVHDLYVKQDIQALEALSGGCCEFNNKYKIFNESGQLVYNATEESDACCRCCCAPIHTMTIHFTDENNKEVATMDRPFKCSGCCPHCFECCNQRATVAMGDDRKIRTMLHQPIGGGGFRPTVNIVKGVTDIEADPTEGEIVGLFEGPKCCFGGFFESTFAVRTPGERETAKVVGTIVKEGTKDFKSAARELLTDADNFKMHFEPDLDPEMRATMMAGQVLLDFMFFENEGLFDCGFENGGWYCSIRPCDCYCYGCVIPCVLKLNTNDLASAG